MAVEKQTAQIILEVDQASAQKSSAEIQRISSPKGIELSVNVAKLEQQLAIVRGKMREAEKNGDFTAALAFRADAVGIQKALTIGRREFTNFTRTGSTQVSALGQLFDNLGKKIGGNTGSLVSQLGGATTALKGFAASALTGAGILGLAAGLTSLAKTAIFLGDRFEQASISFEVMLGSADKAKELLADLSQFAKNSPFELLGIRDAAKQLLAFGITNENLIGTLKALGDVAAGTGTGLDRIAYAFGQVRAAGRLTGNELRQFTEAGVPLLAELAKMYGVTEGKAREMISDNLVGFNDVQQAFVNMTSEGGKFFNLMDRQSETLTGKISNLKDSFNQLLEEGGGGLTPFAKDFIDFFRSVLEEANIFFINLHGGFKLLQAGLVLIINNSVLAFQQMVGNLQIAGNRVVGFFKDLYVNAGILADNIGIAFKKVPGKIAEALNAGIQKIEDFLNKASTGVTNFAKKFGFDIDVGKVTLGRLDSSGAGGAYKEYVNTNEKIAIERNKVIRDEIKGKEELAQRVNELSALALDEEIKSAQAKLNANRELNYKLTQDDEKAEGKKTAGADKGAKEREKIAKEEAALQKDALEAGKDALEDQIKGQEALQKEYEDSIKTLTKGLEELASVQKKLDDLNKNTTEKIADRYTNISEKITDVKDKLSEATSLQESLAKYMSEDTLNSLRATDIIGSRDGEEVTVKQVRDLVKLKKELADLEAEQALAKANTTDEAITASGKSETEKILADAAERKLDLEQERIDIETRIGFKEKEAIDELAILTKKKEDNAIVIDAYKQVVDETEKSITAITKTETEARLSLYTKEINRLNEIARARAAAGLGPATGSTGSSGSKSTTNNTTVVVNATVSSGVDVANLGNDLVKVINNANKGVN